MSGNGDNVTPMAGLATVVKEADDDLRQERMEEVKEQIKAKKREVGNAKNVVRNLSRGRHISDGAPGRRGPPPDLGLLGNTRHAWPRRACATGLVLVGGSWGRVPSRRLFAEVALSSLGFPFSALMSGRGRLLPE